MIASQKIGTSISSNIFCFSLRFHSILFRDTLKNKYTGKFDLESINYNALLTIRILLSKNTNQVWLENFYIKNKNKDDNIHEKWSEFKYVIWMWRLTDKIVKKMWLVICKFSESNNHIYIKKFPFLTLEKLHEK